MNATLKTLSCGSVQAMAIYDTDGAYILQVDTALVTKPLCLPGNIFLTGLC